MGDRDRQGFDAMQRRQGRDADVRQERAVGSRGVRLWRRRSFRAVLLCLLIIVLALAYAIATGRPIPETASHILGILLQVLIGGL